MTGVEVNITKRSEYPTPYGLNYLAKGAYRQGKYIIVVGHIESNSTIRIKYPATDVEVKLIQ